MEHWLVQLHGVQWALEEFARLFHSAHLRVQKVGQIYYLSSLDFAPLGEATQVRHKARKLLALANGIALLNRPSFQPLADQGVSQIDATGNIHPHFIGDSRIVTSPVRFDGSGSPALASPPDTERPQLGEPDRILDLARQEPTVQKALRIFGSREHNWVNLSNILEVIEGDHVSVTDRGWATKTEIRNFSQTANNSIVVGDDARHGHKNWDPPKRAMTLVEAESLMTRILFAWVRSKI